MRRQLIQPYLLLAGIALLLSSCFTEPNYSDVPAIEFKGVFRYTLAAGTGVGQSKRDSVVITIGFKDGKGDLGTSADTEKADTTRYKANGGWGNYEIKTLRLENKQFVDKTPKGINGFLIFPDLARNKPPGAIEGTLDFNQIFPYGIRVYNYPTKFQIRIRDRALQVSNTIETDTLTLPWSIP